MFKHLCAAAAVILTTMAVPQSVAAAVLYDNGPIDGTTNAYGISRGDVVSNSFTLAQGATVTAITFALWTDSGDKTRTVDWAITPGQFLSPVDGTAIVASGAVINTALGGRFDVRHAKISTGAITLTAGTYYLVFQNATTRNGGSAYWDENSGPSTARSNNFVIGSESFQILGYNGSTIPEPATWSLLVVGFGLVGAAARRREINRRSNHESESLAS